MATTIKIQPSSKHLCVRCKFGLVVTSIYGIQTSCNWMGSGETGIRVPDAVLDCTQFDDKAVPSKYDMEKLAWVVSTSTSGKILGFKPPKKEAE